MKKLQVRRIIVFIVLFIFVFEMCFVNVNIVHATENEDPTIDETIDTIAPTIESISFGNSIEDDFIIIANDDLSGADRGILYLRSVNTGEIISADFSNSFFDEEQNINVEYEDGNMHGKLPNAVLNAGIFAIDKIQIWDNAGNMGEYYGKGNPDYDNFFDDSVLSENIASLSLEVNSENNEKPTVEKITIEKTELEGQDETEIEIEIKDDKSFGATSYYVTYYKKSQSTAISTKLNVKERKGDIVIFVGNIKVGVNYESGQYSLSSFYLTDKDGNRQVYSKEEIPESLFEIKKGSKSPYRSIEIVGDKELKAPCYVEFKVHVKDYSYNAYWDDSELESYYMYFRKESTNERKVAKLNKVEKTIGENGEEIENEWDLYYGTNFTKYEMGKYEIEYIFDDNLLYCFGGIGSHNDENDTDIDYNLPEEIYNFSFEVKFKGGITVSILDNNLIDLIKALDNDGMLEIDYSEDSFASGEIFTAIDGTNKEITFTSNEIDWQFNGGTINSSDIKDIDLSANINIIENEDESVKDNLQYLVEDKSTLVVEFANNGQLPGKALISLKTDEDLIDYLGEDSLQVYYWDIDNNLLVSIDDNVEINEKENIVFEIEHCSYYVITGQENKIENNEDPVKAFVTRFYTIILQRNTINDEEIEYYTSRLKSKELDGCSVAKGFVLSPEYVNKNENNLDFVNKMYAAFFNREADDAAFYVNLLEAGYSREVVLAGFVNSPEFKNLCADYEINPGELVVEPQNNNQENSQGSNEENNQGNNEENNQSNNPSDDVTKLNLDTTNVDPDKLDEYVRNLYLKILGREYDESGLEYWKEQIMAGTTYDAATAARVGFFESEEYKNKNKSNQDFVIDCYHAFLGREPEPDGLAYWTEKLDSGEYSKQKVIDLGFGHSEEFKGILRDCGFRIIE